MTRLVRRVGFGLLGLLNAVWGGWAIAAPGHFFRTFPGFGYTWTAAYPPYNEHLVVDLGSTFVVLAGLLGAAAVMDRPVVSGLAGTAVGGFGLVHLGYHVTHAGTMAAGDRALSILTLIGGAFVPPVLAATHLLRRPR